MHVGAGKLSNKISFTSLVYEKKYCIKDFVNFIPVLHSVLCQSLEVDLSVNTLCRLSTALENL